MIMFHDYDDCFDGCEPKFLVRLDDDAIGVKNDNRPDCPYFVFKTKKETAVKYRIPPLFVTLIAAATLASSGAAQAALLQPRNVQHVTVAEGSSTMTC